MVNSAPTRGLHSLFLVLVLHGQERHPDPKLFVGQFTPQLAKGHVQLLGHKEFSAEEIIPPQLLHQRF